MMPNNVLCPNCGKSVPRTPNRQRCKICASERTHRLMRKYVRTKTGREAAYKARCKYRQTAKFRATQRAEHDRVKKECLSHYGNGGKAACCYPGCLVNDVDLLTIDHINDNGAEHRRKNSRRSGKSLYSNLRALQYPDGYQTLCANHQLKKEILRRRRLRK